MIEPTDTARPDDGHTGQEADGAVAIETETGLLVYEPGRPDAWIHADTTREL